MQILSSPELRSLDELTVHTEGISSLELMERASKAFTNAFIKLYRPKDGPVLILCGNGNNGGDGLAVARMLAGLNFKVHVLVLGGSRSPDNNTNLTRARQQGFPINLLEEHHKLPTPAPGVILIDALLGTGLSRPLSGFLEQVVKFYSQVEGLTRIALDLPSGMLADEPSTGTIMQADRTLSLGYPKAALFAPENAPFFGEVTIVPFALHGPAAVRHLRPEGYSAPDVLLDAATVSRLIKPRRANDHKGTFGHALLVAGSFGKMGAAVLAARAVLRSGAGLVTAHVPRSGYEIMQIAFPEAMCTVDAHRYHATEVGDVNPYATIGIGPGLGTKNLTVKLLSNLLKRYDRPMVLDADALNILGQHQELFDEVPKGSILTPHPKEFQRLFGDTTDSFARWQVQREMAVHWGIYIVLKTGYTTIATPEGKIYANPTGNPGMGTAGTGDVLTGLLTGLLAQGYDSKSACLLGVYLHGLAGDLAAEDGTQQFLIAEDVINNLGAAYRELQRQV
ncbi:bifunctional ADP-dependent NAD(P)H-hydrate dehydratase/NAD(P)H-hydrate epimerase [Lewinella sp. 4G2]|uniref:bifunctional ADP-dependent NAD(P)H-hydrate dehydratase/NAD(P)H-hydrate epimerase n=1 Tax=Lewinella sp. 4G2 TaxID=1803372 RepID=UPI0007B4BC09|nr:bifunctional ADP-dependent NAD(P)H-hydrate dehydratase/NAD(P)H-hydrate epimerase [Lewinella sp. 4G2]OAV45652.1 hypothetical protein A3850_014625 [Lewinella sp. 4G2]